MGLIELQEVRAISIKGELLSFVAAGIVAALMEHFRGRVQVCKGLCAKQAVAKVFTRPSCEHLFRDAQARALPSICRVQEARVTCSCSYARHSSQR